MSSWCPWQNEGHLQWHVHWSSRGDHQWPGLSRSLLMGTPPLLANSYSWAMGLIKFACNFYIQHSFFLIFWGPVFFKYTGEISGAVQKLAKFHGCLIYMDMRKTQSFPFLVQLHEFLDILRLSLWLRFTIRPQSNDKCQSVHAKPLRPWQNDWKPFLTSVAFLIPSPTPWKLLQRPINNILNIHMRKHFLEGLKTKNFDSSQRSINFNSPCDTSCFLPQLSGASNEASACDICLPVDDPGHQVWPALAKLGKTD